MLEVRVVGDLVQGAHRLVHGQVHVDEPVLDHGQDQRGRAELEVRGDLGEVRVADDHVEPAVLLGVGVRFVPGVDDGPLEGGLQSHLDLEVVRALADLEAVFAPVLADADAAGAGDDLAGDEEGGQVAHDLREGGFPLHQVVLVRAVGGALVVGVVLVEVDRLGAGQLGGPFGGLGHDPFAGLVPEDGVERVGDLRRAVLGVGVVHVEPCAVGEDDVGEADVLVGELAVVGGLAGEVEAAGVPQRILLLEVPAGASRPVHRRRVGVDDLGRGEHGIGVRVPRNGDPVLRFDPHYSPYGHAALLARRRSRSGAALKYRLFSGGSCAVSVPALRRRRYGRA
ncbi:hypothetical protein [Streptomyces sp. NPDC048551]|uniref:hypothetical protein n=1 Tax=Streptomyces sp. NPDC048551 TaxID=3155758 RepID=UPI003427FC76